MRKQLFLLVGLVVASSPVSAVTLDWVLVGNPGNGADSANNCYAAGCGSVSYSYFISKYETTNAQYAEFLNAVDPGGSNSLALYSTSMDSNAISGGISFFAGNASGSKYVVKSGFASKPVTYVSFYDALRFSNWLNNGQGGGDTESGAYTLLGGTATPTNGLTVTRNGGAITFLTSENEWYKAAYFNGATYFDYPAGSNTQTVCAAPTATANRANCNRAVSTVTEVGAYTGSASPYGTFDQGGNLAEWNEQITTTGDFRRSVRGGGPFFGAGNLAASARFLGDPPSNEGIAGGFRVASLVPEPGTGLLVMTGLAGLAAKRRRRTS